MSILILNILYSIIICAFIAALLSMEITSRKLGACAMPSSPWMRRVVIDQLAQIMAQDMRYKQDSKSPLIIDLGSGWGGLALRAAKIYPNAQVRGYELSLAPLYIARLRTFFGGHKNLCFIKQDFFSVDLRKVDIVMTYLTPQIMTPLADKLKGELAKDAYVIANTFPLPDWKTVNIVAGQNKFYHLNVYIYQKGMEQSAA